MNTEEIFEIQDFTCSTEWELFIVNIEDHLRSWMADPPLETINHSLTYDDNVFFLEYHRALHQNISPVYDNEGISLWPFSMKELLSKKKDIDFDYSSFRHYHPIKRWFGFSSFIILYPSIPSLSTFNMASLLLSSLCIAASSCSVTLPLFVPIYPSYGVGEGLMYLGRMTSGMLSLRIESIARRYIPPSLRHLAGIEEFFHDMISKNGYSLENVIISVSFTFELLASSLLHSSSWNPCSIAGIKLLSSYDPIHRVSLITSWPFFPEGTFVNNAMYSDLDPKGAPFWQLIAFWESNRLSIRSTPLTISLRNLLTELKKGIRYDEISDITNSNSHSNTNVMNSMRLIFGEYFNGSKDIDIDKENEEMKDNNLPEVGKPLLKSAPFHSLLSLFVLYLLKNKSSLKEVLILFNDFVKSIRFHWENKEPLPHMPSTEDTHSIIVDHSFSIIHQKLSLINYCIKESTPTKESKKPSAGIISNFDMSMNGDFTGWGDLDIDIEVERNPALKEKKIKIGQDRRAKFRKQFHSNEDDSDSDSSDSDDENNNISFDSEPTSSKVSSLAPLGVSSEHPSLKLLSSKIPLNIPITQKTPISTEDAVMHQQRLMETLVKVNGIILIPKLGSSKEDNLVKLHANIQSQILFSDMQAFKAANPSCSIEDFIRWHSPNDFIDDEKDENKGHLSTRMSDPNNLWHHLWREAKSIPSISQPPLFDDQKEAEMALHYLETIHPADLMSQLMLVALDDVYLLLNHACNSIESHFYGAAKEHLKGALLSLSPPSIVTEDSDAFINECESVFTTGLGLINEIGEVELEGSRALSLQSRFPETRIVDMLLADCAVSISADERKILLSSISPTLYESPSIREFTLIGTSEAGHRMYVSLSCSIFQLSYAISDSQKSNVYNIEY